MAIKSYKGFDKNLRCRDFQYKIGGIYEMDGEIKVCNRGFHACESPFDVFDYYTMIDSRFCEVEQDGNISKEDRGTKICSSKIKIKAELKLADMIYLGVEWLKEITSPEKIKTSIKDNSSGYGAKIGSSGNYAQIDSTGEGCVIILEDSYFLINDRNVFSLCLAECSDYDLYELVHNIETDSDQGK